MTSKWLKSILTILALAAAAAWLGRPALAQQTGRSPWLEVEIGKTRVNHSELPITRLLLSDPEIADVQLLDDLQFSIRGLKVGSTDLWVWHKGGSSEPESYVLTVHRDLSDLVRRVGELATNPPRVLSLNGRLVVEGPVPDVETLERIAAVAHIFDEDFVDLMTVQGDHQVQLDVVFAQVDRTGLREMGFNSLWSDADAAGMLTGPVSMGPIYGHSGSLGNTLGGLVTGETAVLPQQSSEVFNLVGLLANPTHLTAVLSVLEQNSLSKILARPTLVALSGQQAEFLSGGEVPMVVAQVDNRIRIDFKEYGVKLVFVPTVLADHVIDIRVHVEVSEPDPTTGTNITGVSIPGFITRKGETHLRIDEGMTFAMAGMLGETVKETVSRVPILGDIPLVGSLFRHVQHRRSETELMIFVTPHLVRPLAAEEVPPAPGTTQDDNPNDFELFMLGLDHRIGAGAAEPAGPAGMSP